MDKLYIVIRKDLPTGLQHAQIAHAALKFAHDHPALVSCWYYNSNNIAILEVADEHELRELYAKTKSAGLVCSVFEEPDLGNEATAIAAEPRAKRLFRRLPPAAKKRAQVPFLSHELASS